MKYAGIKKLLLEAIGERFCTADGMKRFIEPKISAEINAVDLDAVLYQMCVEDDLVRLSNAGFSAYFPAKNVPMSFFRAGGGKINAVYDKPNVGLPVRVIRPDDLTAAKIKEIAVIPYFTEKELQTIEDLTARSCTNREIAGEMAIDEYLLARRARHDLPMRKAISEGHKRRESPGTAQIPVAKKVLPVKESKPRRRVVDVRPFAEIVETEPAQAAESRAVDENLKRRFSGMKRLCACGNPLGARSRECRDCWLRIKYPRSSAGRPKDDAGVDRRIKEVLSQAEFDPERLSEILLGVILEYSPNAAKERLAETLCRELMEASRTAA